jgi:hypothetical protein
MEVHAGLNYIGVYKIKKGLLMNFGAPILEAKQTIRKQRTQLRSKCIQILIILKS